MAFVEVQAGSVSGGKIARLTVKMHGLPVREIDRDTALAWMIDGHSLVPVARGEKQPALQLVEVGDERFIRADNAPTAADALPTW